MRKMKMADKKRKMWFRSKSSIGKKESNIVTLICIILGIIAIVSNVKSINYYKYCFIGIKTQAVVNDIQIDDVAYWDSKAGMQSIKTYTDLYVTFDGYEDVFEKSNCKVIKGADNTDMVSVAYLPGQPETVITDFSWGKLIKNIVLIILFVVSILITIHERKGYAYNKKHMKVKKISNENDVIQI